MFKQHVKVSCASDDPFTGYVMVGFGLGVGFGLELFQQKKLTQVDPRTPDMCNRP